MAILIMDALLTVFVCVFSYVWTGYLKPWLELHHLTEAAEIAVAAAEAIYGRYHGKEKLQEALNQLENLGFDITADDVINAVKAAWQKLNLKQIEVGEKDVTE